MRVLGVMIGIELAVEGAPVVKACLERRLLINCTQGTVIRLLPAMNLDDRTGRRRLRHSGRRAPACAAGITAIESRYSGIRENSEAWQSEPPEFSRIPLRRLSLI